MSELQTAALNALAACEEDPCRLCLVLTETCHFGDCATMQTAARHGLQRLFSREAAPRTPDEAEKQHALETAVMNLLERTFDPHKEVMLSRLNALVVNLNASVLERSLATAVKTLTGQ